MAHGQDFCKLKRVPQARFFDWILIGTLSQMGGFPDPFVTVRRFRRWRVFEDGRGQDGRGRVGVAMSDDACCPSSCRPQCVKPLWTWKYWPGDLWTWTYNVTNQGRTSTQTLKRTYSTNAARARRHTKAREGLGQHRQCASKGHNVVFWRNVRAARHRVCIGRCMRPSIISNGTIFYSLLYCNSLRLYIRLKYMYSVISVKLDWLPGNSKKWTID